MQIGANSVVLFHYTLRDEAGEERETSRGSDPAAYLHGANNMIPGLEAAMAMEGTDRTIMATTLEGCFDCSK